MQHETASLKSKRHKSLQQINRIQKEKDNEHSELILV